jgi:hypothetical protein
VTIDAGVTASIYTKDYQSALVFVRLLSQGQPVILQSLADSTLPDGIGVEADGPAHSSPIKPDLGQIRITLSNLVHNACDATPPAGG